MVTVATARDHDNISYLGACGRRWGERHRGNRYYRHGCKGTRRKSHEQQMSHKATPLIAYCVYKEMLRAQIKFPETLRQIDAERQVVEKGSEIPSLNAEQRLHPLRGPAVWGKSTNVKNEEKRPNLPARFHTTKTLNQHKWEDFTAIHSVFTVY
jgi:hypothetical protein